jgi:hypothetical protein
MNLKSSQRWGILIGMGRMSQTNPILRAVWAPKWIEVGGGQREEKQADINIYLGM